MRVAEVCVWCGHAIGEEATHASGAGESYVYLAFALGLKGLLA